MSTEQISDGLLVIRGNELLLVEKSYWMKFGSCRWSTEIFSNQHSDSAKSESCLISKSTEKTLRKVPINNQHFFSEIVKIINSYKVISFF